MELVKKLIKTRALSKEEYLELLMHWENVEVQKAIYEEARKQQKKYYGNKVYARGLIEFTNYCKNNCFYCGIRKGNHHACRYRLTKEEILECCEQGYQLGFRTFVLQGGEDPYYTDERMVDIISSIRKTYPECAITLSIGEKRKESYKKYKDAGANRYLLRHETADDTHYQKLHPEHMKLSVRKQCLYDLKELGYQVGAGFMVGSPEQTMEHLAQDLVFLQQLKPEMVGIGPFIPHHDTLFKDEKAGSVELTVFLLAVIRVILPKVLLPATTALGTMDPQGREKALQVGANVVMPNLSPLSHRKQYELYDNKLHTGVEACEAKNELAKRFAQIGYILVDDRGDAVNFQ